jgi:8-oxo-dGTP diphosphatase
MDLRRTSQGNASRATSPRTADDCATESVAGRDRWPPRPPNRLLLVHRIHDGLDDWVLPGGTPREGENMTACARRELFEETGISADPTRVALVVESVPPGSSQRTVDIVFLATEPVLGRAHSREPGLEPHFISPGQLAELDLHPSLAGHLYRLLDPGAHGYAPYVGNFWRQSTIPS